MELKLVENVTVMAPASSPTRSVTAMTPDTSTSSLTYTLTSWVTSSASS